MTRFRPGDQLWSAAEASDRVLLVERGLVLVSQVSIVGEVRVLDLATGGAVVGLAEVYLGLPRGTQAEALSGGAAAWLERPALLQLLRHGGAGADAMMGLVARASRSSGRRVVEVGYGSVEQRVARVALRLGEDLGISDARGTLVPLRISRTQVATIVGCRLETVVRALRGPELKPLLTMQREGILLHDMAALRRLAS